MRPLPGRQYAGVGSLLCGLATALGLCVSCVLDGWETLAFDVDSLLESNSSAGVRRNATVSGDAAQDGYIVLTYAADGARNQTQHAVGLPCKIRGGLWASCDYVDDSAVSRLEKAGVTWWVNSGHCLYDEDMSTVTTTQQSDYQTRQTATRTAQACLIVAAICIAVALLLELCNLFILHSIVSLLAATTSFCTGVYVAFALALVTVRMDHPEHFNYNNVDVNSAFTLSQPALSTWISVATLLVAFLASVWSTLYSRYLREDVRSRAIKFCRRAS